MLFIIPAEGPGSSWQALHAQDDSLYIAGDFVKAVQVAEKAPESAALPGLI